ncbi:universal stress protein [Arthrobacter celericrescens]|uniref:universal stress protein n=1 Tax=Arthrobacter celericrescens TaxID=2320851 RepID=UPI000EA2E028|nr:universal stress protein [Arthrobacter celericrescens]
MADKLHLAHGAGSGPTLAGPILTGIVPHHRAAVLQQAADLALRTGAELLLAYVDPALDGERQPIDPDAVDDDAADIASELRAWIAAQLEGSGVDWSFTVLAGDPAHELLRYAADTGASTIVVGSKEHGLGRYLEALAGGSLGERLARHAGPPVLIVPLGRQPEDDAR